MGAVILSACRTPIGSFGGALKDLTAPQLGVDRHPRGGRAGRMSPPTASTMC